MPIQKDVYNNAVVELFETIKKMERNVHGFPQPDDFYEAINLKNIKKTLSDLSSCFNPHDKTLKNSNALVDFLGNYWASTQGTLFDYTANPDSYLSDLLCKIAELESKRLDVAAIKLLMPNLWTESAREEDYPDIDTLDLKNLFRTHIIGGEKSYRYLVPVRCIFDVVSKPEREQFNYYYDYTQDDYEEKMSDDVDKKRDFSLLSESERQRLIAHSRHTRDLYDAVHLERSLEKNETDLLSNLNELCRALQFNDAHGGIGQNERAGEGAYAAIANFSDYYGQLSDAEKKRIPKNVVDEINELLMKASNKNTVGTIETCIGTRREQLSYAMKNNEDILRAIRLDNAQSALRLKAARERRGNAEKTLNELLVNNNYAGTDKLGFNGPLLRRLNVTFNVTSKETFDIFMRCTSQDMCTLITHNPALHQQIRAQFTSVVESVVTFIVSGGHERSKLHVIFDIIASLPGLQSGRNWGLLLMPLTPDQCKMVCSTLLSKVALSSDHFFQILQSLSPEKRTIVFESQKARLDDIIKTGVDFCNVLRFLNPEQRTFVFNEQKDRLIIIIGSAIDFGYVLSNLGQADFNHMVANMAARFIKSDEDLGEVLNVLVEPQFAALISAMQSRLIVSSSNLLNIHAVLDDQRKQAFLETQQARIGDMIKIEDNFATILWLLIPQQRTIVFESQRARLGDMIITADHFAAILKLLTPKQRTIVFDSQIARLGDMIITAKDFKHVMCHLNAEQRTFVFDSQKKRWSDIIQCGEALADVLSYLNAQQRTDVINEQKERLVEIISSARDFGFAVKFLGVTDFNDMIANMAARFIKSDKDLGYALSVLGYPQLTCLMNAMQSRLSPATNLHDIFSVLDESHKTAFLQMSPAYLLQMSQVYLDEIIQSSLKFWLFMESLNDEQRTIVFELQRARLSDIIQNGSDFHLVLKELNDEQRAIVFESQRPRLSDIIQNGEDFEVFLTFLNDEQRAIVFESQRPRLSDIIDSGFDFRMVLMQLRPEQQVIVFNDQIGRLEELIESAKDFGDALEQLPRAQFNQVIAKMGARFITSDFDLGEAVDRLLTGPDVVNLVNAMPPELIASSLNLKNIFSVIQDEIVYLSFFEMQQARFGAMIQTGLDFANILCHLYEDERTIVFESQRARLGDIIITTEDLVNVLCYLTAEQRAYVFNEQNDRLVRIISSAKDFGYLGARLDPEAFNDMVDNMAEHLIKTDQDLGAALSVLDNPQFTSLINAMQSRLIVSPLQLDNIVGVLDEPRKKLFLATQQERLGKIKSGSELWRIIEPVSDNKNKYQPLMKLLEQHLGIEKLKALGNELVGDDKKGFDKCFHHYQQLTGGKRKRGNDGFFSLKNGQRDASRIENQEDEMKYEGEIKEEKEIKDEQEMKDGQEMKDDDYEIRSAYRP